MCHQSNCTAGLLNESGNGFKQLERCWSHHLDCLIRQAMSARYTKEVDADSDYPYLVEDSDDKDELCNEEEEEEEEEEEDDDDDEDQKRTCSWYILKSSWW
jgi:hypothetical protein